MPQTTDRSFSDLLHAAVTEPGLISAAFSAFNNYSIGNQLLAFMQCRERGITPGPLATFMGWKQKGRSVRKGEKALVLCMPVTCKKRTDEETEDGQATFTRFVYRPNWFVLAQTDGVDVPALALPEWTAARALSALDVTEIPFTMLNGNVEGYAIGRTLAVSPVSQQPHATRFHELAHIVLGHTLESAMTDSETTSRNLQEVEAEAVALVCLEALELPGAEFCRGYIQSWHRSNALIPERNAQRILKAADTILRAGREAVAIDQAA